ncbi:MAG: ribonuclease T [Cardiobacteriaceae bacterium]|nr:ribonuclease T [Cardiobacteriaceae bacterium]
MSDLMEKRFRGFMPVVVDVETGGFEAKKHALLEVAAVLLDFNEAGLLERKETLHYHVLPFEGALLDPESLKVNGISDPFHPLRLAFDERVVAERLFGDIRKHQKQLNCTRSILVGHNAGFDLSFINAMVERIKYKHNPFHPFSTFDTVTLGALAYGQTVLARIAKLAGLDYDGEQAHGAKYDAELTADLFCQIINTWQEKVGVVGLPHDKERL